MSEDYTWNEAEPTRAHPVQVAALKAANARLAARVQELERELADMRSRQLAQGGKNAERLAGVVLDGERYRQRAETAERENAELRAKLDAVPVAEMQTLAGIVLEEWGESNSAEIVYEWIDALGLLQPADDTDAPLTLAAIDGEDGDL